MKYRIKMEAHIDITFSRPLTDEELASLAAMKYPDGSVMDNFNDILLSVSDDLEDVSIVSVLPCS